MNKDILDRNDAENMAFATNLVVSRARLVADKLELDPDEIVSFETARLLNEGTAPKSMWCNTVLEDVRNRCLKSKFWLNGFEVPMVTLPSNHVLDVVMETGCLVRSGEYPALVADYDYKQYGITPAMVEALCARDQSGIVAFLIYGIYGVCGVEEPRIKIPGVERTYRKQMKLVSKFSYSFTRQLRSPSLRHIDSEEVIKVQMNQLVPAILNYKIKGIRDVTKLINKVEETLLNKD